MSELDLILRPRERILYRALPGRKRQLVILFPCLLIGGTIPFFCWIVGIPVPGSALILFASLACFFLVIFHLGRAFYSEILVTEERLIISTGQFELAKVKTLNLSEIAGLSPTKWTWPGSIFMEDKNGRFIRIPSVYAPEKLANEIAKAGALEHPKKPSWNFVLVENLLPVVIVLCFLFLFYPIGYFVSNTAWRPVDFDSLSIFSQVIIIAISFFIASLAIQIVYMLGCLVTSIMLPWLLSPEEAKQFLGRRCEKEEGLKFLNGLNRVNISLMGKILSHLYGQPIRRNVEVTPPALTRGPRAPGAGG